MKSIFEHFSPGPSWWACWPRWSGRAASAGPRRHADIPYFPPHHQPRFRPSFIELKKWHPTTLQSSRVTVTRSESSSGVDRMTPGDDEDDQDLVIFTRLVRLLCRGGRNALLDPSARRCFPAAGTGAGAAGRGRGRGREGQRRAIQDRAVQADSIKTRVESAPGACN